MSPRPPPLWALVAAVLIGGVGGLGLGRIRVEPNVFVLAECESAMGAVLRQHGAVLFSEGNYVAARELFQKTAPVWPGVAALRKGLLQAEREVRIQQILDEVERAISAEDFDSASFELAQIDQRTLQVERREKLGQLLDRLCEEAITRLEDTWSSEDLEAVSKACSRRPQLAVRASEVMHARDTSSGRARVRFRRGDSASAFAYAHGCRLVEAGCRGLVEELNSFFGRYRRVEELSVDELEELQQDANRISPHAHYLGTINDEMVDRLDERAQLAEKKGDWRGVYDAAKRALALQPDSTASRLLDEARFHAKELYMQGYVLKDSAPMEARALFKQVTELTPADDELHLKALHRLAQ